MNYHETDVRKWDEHKMEGNVLLRLEVRNKLATRCQVQANIKIAGTKTGDENIVLPVTPGNAILFAGDCRVLRFYQKKDCTQEGWPKMEIAFMSEQLANNTSYTSTSTSGTTNYVSSGVGTGSAYVPSGVSTSSVKIGCRNQSCNAMCDFGMDFCDTCGESQKDDNMDSQVYENFY